LCVQFLSFIFSYFSCVIIFCYSGTQHCACWEKEEWKGLAEVRSDGKVFTIHLCLRWTKKLKIQTDMLPTHILTHSLWLVKIHICPTKSWGTHIYLVGHISVLTNKKKCVENCLLKCELLVFLKLKIQHGLVWHLHTKTSSDPSLKVLP